MIRKNYKIISIILTIAIITPLLFGINLRYSPESSKIEIKLAKEATAGWILSPIGLPIYLPIPDKDTVSCNLFVAGASLLNCIVSIYQIILQIMTSFFAYLIAVFASWLDLLAQQASGIKSTPFVDVGWNVMVTIVNSLFIIVLIMIAYATILRTQTYNIKTMLPRLIIIALLINFSLVAGSFIVDFSNGLSNWLINQAIGGGKLSERIANVYKIQTLENTNGIIQENVKSEEYNDNLNKSESASTISNLGKILGIIISSFFTFGYTFLAFIAIAGMAIILIIRHLFLAILLAIAPLAWFAYLLPNTRQYFSEWWNNLLKWSLVAPILMLFLVIFIKSLEGGALEIHDFSSLITAFGMTALLLGGIYISQKMGVAGANLAMSMTQGTAKNVSQRIANRAARTVGESKATGWLGEKAKTSQTAALLYGAGFGQIKEYSSKVTKDAEKKLENKSEASLHTILSNPLSNKEEQIASAAILLKKGKADDLIQKYGKDGAVKYVKEAEKAELINETDMIGFVDLAVQAKFGPPPKPNIARGETAASPEYQQKAAEYSGKVRSFIKSNVKKADMSKVKFSNSVLENNEIAVQIIQNSDEKQIADIMKNNPKAREILWNKNEKGERTEAKSYEEIQKNFGENMAKYSISNAAQGLGIQIKDYRNAMIKIKAEKMKEEAIIKRAAKKGAEEALRQAGYTEEEKAAPRSSFKEKPKY